MMEGYTDENARLYIIGLKASIRHQKSILLREKLRRLEARVAQREGAQK
jgi:hypothetical protein